MFNAVALLTAGAPAILADAAPPIDVVGTIRSLRIPSGAYAGGYVTAPGGYLSWYLANLALIGVVRLLDASELEALIRPYLELYLRSLKRNYAIDDVTFPAGAANWNRYALQASDSDDSYAATLLSLATRYVACSGNWKWWDRHVNTFKPMANSNLVRSIKSNSLSCVFQYPRSRVDSRAYLMDNCEVYRGLRDFAAMLHARSDPGAAARYDDAATRIASGVADTLFDPTFNAFRPDDRSRPQTRFYAGTACQVFPQVFGLAEDAARFDAGWAWLNTHSPDWPRCAYDRHPWMVLGYAAAKRGASAQARTQVETVERMFVDRRRYVTINELGWYQRTKSLLAGQSDV